MSYQENLRAAQAEFQRLLVQESGRLDPQLGVSFAVNRRLKGPMGRAVFGLGYVEVQMSASWLEVLSVAEVLDTVRHEFAHVVAGPGHGHDAVWKAHARRLGASPNARKKVSARPASKYVLVCEKCEKVCGNRQRKTSTVWKHNGCGGRVTLRDGALAAA